MFEFKVAAVTSEKSCELCGNKATVMSFLADEMNVLCGSCFDKVATELTSDVTKAQREIIGKRVKESVQYLRDYCKSHFDCAGCIFEPTTRSDNCPIKTPEDWQI